MSDPRALIEQARALLAEAESAALAGLGRERGRARGALNQIRWDAAKMQRPERARLGFSQAGQDMRLDALVFRGKRRGTFVDLGGFDGAEGSNTLFFELFRDWSGVLVEPSPARIAEARALRRCPCLRAAVAGARGEAEFMEITSGYRQMSGLVASYDPGLLDAVRGNPAHEERRFAVQTRTLPDILDEAGLRAVDYVSLDVEGGELAILESFPFDRYDIAAWSIENNAGGPEIGRIMRAAGYDLIEYCGQDELYALPGAMRGADPADIARA